MEKYVQASPGRWNRKNVLRGRKLGMDASERWAFVQTFGELMLACYKKSGESNLCSVETCEEKYVNYESKRKSVFNDDGDNDENGCWFYMDVTLVGTLLYSEEPKERDQKNDHKEQKPQQFSSMSDLLTHARSQFPNGAQSQVPYRIRYFGPPDDDDDDDESKAKAKGCDRCFTNKPIL